MNKNLCIAICLYAAICIIGCRQQQKPSIAFIAGAATDFWTLAEAGAKKAGRELDSMEVIFKYTTDGATEEQKRMLDDVVANGAAGIIISPLDPLNQAPLIDQVAAITPVIITDSDIPESKRLCYIGTSNLEAGRLAGQLIKEAIPAGGKIMLFVGKADAQNAKERIEGIRAVIEGSNIRIIDIKTDNIDRVRAKANVNDALVSHPDMACLVGLWSYNGPAILNAVKESGKNVKIVCFDEEEETLAGVQEGSIYATVVQQPFEFGYQSIKMMDKYLKGDKTALPADKKLIIPVQAIRKENAPAYIEKMKTLRTQ